MSRRNLWIIGVVLLCAVAWAGTASAQLSGAIFTSTEDGSIVNQNLYDKKTDVYLNGGPKPGHCDNLSAGLPEGDYYFQVTDPSGQTLLSTDDISCRMFHVDKSGKISNYVSGGGSCTDHDTGGPTPCEGITVQLYPYSDTPNPGGVYKVWVTPVGKYDPSAGSFGFIEAWSKTDVFKVKESVKPPQEVATITGYKFYDTNTNGVKDPGEPGIANWLINLYQGASPGDIPFDFDYTDATGLYVFEVAAGSGAYTVCEVIPPPPPVGTATWIPTTPTCVQVTAGTGAIQGPNFGNVCLGPGGGLTLGFWSNKNGQKLITSSDLLALKNLCLRNASGQDFDPGNALNLRTWLLGANATNMAYMLSAQLAAMKLNVLHGFVNGNALIYAPGTQSANAAGFATVNAIMAEANAELCAHGTAYAGDSRRSYQEALKNALDNANNNKNFVQPPNTCPVYYPGS